VVAAQEYISYNDTGSNMLNLEESASWTASSSWCRQRASGEGGERSFNGGAFQRRARHRRTLAHDELGIASNNHYHTGCWALDTPFPYWKRWAGAEGGVADMCIVSWPAQIDPQDGIRHQYIHAVDVVPTLYDLLGIEPPAVLKGYPQHPIEGQSFAAALTDPDAPGRDTQFYAMLGQRSIYHEGWLACTVHPPLSGWGNFAADEWELFHLETDRSQTVNLAAEEPERLEMLKGLWHYNAGRYNGLPLDDRTALEQVLAERPRAAAPRDRYTFYPDCADVPESAGPAVNGRSYTIAGGIVVDSPDVEGVIWAAGGVPGGHSLYVKDGVTALHVQLIGTVL
jgi:arylsulfatase